MSNTTNTTTVAIGGGGSSSLPLGLRNNNPLNIRVSNNNWLGKVASDNGFEKFETLELGVRAGVKNLITYYNNYGLKTISKIIYRWSPPSENHTETYIKYVSGRMDLDANAIFVYSKQNFAALVSAMSEIELGKSYGISKDKVLSVINQYKLIQ